MKFQTVKVGTKLKMKSLSKNCWASLLTICAQSTFLVVYIALVHNYHIYSMQDLTLFLMELKDSHF